MGEEVGRNTFYVISNTYYVKRFTLRCNTRERNVPVSLYYCEIKLKNLSLYSRTALALRYLKYWFSASNGKGHGVHSPFVFDFITSVLNDKRYYYTYDAVEAMRDRMLADKRVLTVQDLGAGSALTASRQRTVGSIARQAAKPPKYGKLMFRMVEKYQPGIILELGTSLGITTSYLAGANRSAQLYTIEGAPEVAAIARDNFKALELPFVQLREGNFDEVLPRLLSELPRVDFAFIDGNHREQPTLDYFHQLLQKRGEKMILVFDDIHWSQGMEAAWKAIREHPEVQLTIDLFFVGIVVFDPAFRVPQHFRIRF